MEKNSLFSLNGWLLFTTDRVSLMISYFEKTLNSVSAKIQIERFSKIITVTVFLELTSNWTNAIPIVCFQWIAQDEEKGKENLNRCGGIAPHQKIIWEKCGIEPHVLPPTSCILVLVKNYSCVVKHLSHLREARVIFVLFYNTNFSF